MCPFCEWKPRPQSETSIEDQRVEHVGLFHRDRIRAAKAYNAAIVAGASEADARKAYNVALYHRGPGRYDRVHAPMLAGAT